MTEGDWFDAGRRVIGLLFGDEWRDPDDHLFLMYLNAHDADLKIDLPAHPRGWELFVDTAGDARGNVFAPLPVENTHPLHARSFVLFGTRPSAPE